MKHYSLILLLAVILIPAYGYTEIIPPQDPNECPCNTNQLPNDGPTGLEILAEICPGGKLAPDAVLTDTPDDLRVLRNDPERTFRVAIDTEDNDNLFCNFSQGIPLLGIGQLTTEQFVNCRVTVIQGCGLPRPIPTLSEWGLIALAGVLGIVGIAVIRRKRTAA